jgi:hypothetical protein
LLFYKDNGGTVQKIGYKLTPTTAGGTGLTSFTNGGVVYASSTSALATGSALVFDGTQLNAVGAVIGVATPLRISNSSATTNGRGAGLEFYGSSNTFGRIEGFWAGSDEQVRLFSTGSMTFSTAGTEGLRLTNTSLYTASTINVGIGTSSPDQKLTIVGNQKITGYIELRSANRIYFDDSGNTASGSIWNAGTGATLSFSGDGTNEQMRLDSGGNLLVKWTAYNGASNTAGAGINAVGQIAVERDGGIAGVFNRFSSDGQLLVFRRQGTTVGTVDVTTTGVTLTGTNGISFTTTQSASSDANTLDDYEEGSWTYDFTATTGTITKSATYLYGYYTKVGRVVTITGFLQVTSVSSPTGVLTLTGLPFPITSTGSREGFVGGGIYGSSLAAGSVSPLMVSGSAGSSSLTISKFVAGSFANLAGDVVADTRFQISFSYFS